MTTDEQAGVRYCIPPCCLICGRCTAYENFHYCDENKHAISNDEIAEDCTETCEHFTLRDFGQEIETVVG